MPAATASSWRDWSRPIRLHRELFLATLIALNVPPTLLGRLTLALGPVQFDRNTNRSVLGSLRTPDIDLSWLIQDLHVLDCNPEAVALELNERTMSVKGEGFYPVKEMLGCIHDLGGKGQ